jgi:Fe-S cluster assembly protein SufD
MVIKTYDVRCTHGATIGRLDQEELFYLHSRGFTREQAEWLVVRGYFGPVLDRVANDQVREDIEAVVLRRAASRD